MNFSQKSFLGLSLSAVLLTACSFGGNLEQGELVSGDAIATEANDGKRIAVEGYPYIAGDVTLDGTTSIDIYTEPAGEGEWLIALPIFYGEEGSKNTFYIPDEFSDEDVVLYDNEGNAIAYDEAAMFSFNYNLGTNYGSKVRIDLAE